MRTIELSDEIFEQAERVASARGISVVEYFGQKVVEDVRSAPLEPTDTCVKFPIFDSNSPGALRNTKEILEELELEDDLRRSGYSA